MKKGQMGMHMWGFADIFIFLAGAIAAVIVLWYLGYLNLPVAPIG